MSTVSDSTAPDKSPLNVGLLLTISGVPYVVTRLDPDPSIASCAFRLSRLDGVNYNVAMTVHGAGCDCQDFNYRAANTREGCKHVRACRQVGLLPPLPPLDANAVKSVHRSTGDLAANDPKKYAEEFSTPEDDWADYPDSERWTVTDHD
jgi:hypothetical protein